MSDSNSDIPSEFPFLNLKIQNSGSSKRLTIPADVVDDAELETGETVQAKYDRKEGTLTFYLN